MQRLRAFLQMRAECFAERVALALQARRDIFESPVKIVPASTAHSISCVLIVVVPFDKCVNEKRKSSLLWRKSVDGTS